MKRLLLLLTIIPTIAFSMELPDSQNEEYMLQDLQLRASTLPDTLCQPIKTVERSSLLVTWEDLKRREHKIISYSGTIHAAKDMIALERTLLSSSDFHDQDHAMFKDYIDGFHKKTDLIFICPECPKGNKIFTVYGCTARDIKIGLFMHYKRQHPEKDPSFLEDPNISDDLVNPYVACLQNGEWRYVVHPFAKVFKDKPKDQNKQG